MARSVSNTLKAAAYAPQTDEIFHILIEIDHTDLDTPLRFVNNYEDVTSNGDTYTAFPFEISLPADTEDKVPNVELTIDNVDRTIVENVRTISSTEVPTVDVSVVLASAPNTVEIGPLSFNIKSAEWDFSTVRFQLAYEDILNEPFPGDSFTPNNFPGLF